MMELWVCLPGWRGDYGELGLLRLIWIFLHGLGLDLDKDWEN